MIHCSASTWRRQLKYIRLGWCPCIGSSKVEGTDAAFKKASNADLRKVTPCTKTQVRDTTHVRANACRLVPADV